MKGSVKVLVVDDEPDVVEILNYNLTKDGYTVFKAFNGLEAIDSAIKNLPDIIIMDVRMPGITGIEVCRKMRTIERLKDIPVLFLTADADEYTTLNAFEAGANHFITKPIRPSLLVDLINEVLIRK